MISVNYLFLISSFLLVVTVIITNLEEKKQKRLFLPMLRDHLDKLLLRLVKSIKDRLHYLLRHIIKLSWYYSIHSTLRAVMVLLVRAYDWLETIVINNRERARKLRAEGRALMQDNYLTEIEKHKASTALTANQKKKLRAKKLERD